MAVPTELRRLIKRKLSFIHTTVLYPTGIEHRTRQWKLTIVDCGSINHCCMCIMWVKNVRPKTQQNHAGPSQSATISGLSSYCNETYPLVITRGNGESPINGGFSGKIIHKWSAMFDYQRVRPQVATRHASSSHKMGEFLPGWVMQLYASGPGLPKFLAARLLSKFAASLGKAIWRLKQILMHLMHSIPQIKCTMMQHDILNGCLNHNVYVGFNYVSTNWNQQKFHPSPTGWWCVHHQASSVNHPPATTISIHHLLLSSPSIRPWVQI